MARVFVDSSVLIAKAIRASEMRKKIEARLSQFEERISGEVALLEFKRRVLKDVGYLLTKLNKFKSYERTLDHVTSLPLPHHRKQNICLSVLHKILPGAGDAELTERARRYFRTLLVCGEDLIKADLDR